MDAHVIMTTTAFVLIMISAVLHISWNVIGKKSSQSVLFYAWTTACGGLIFSPLLLLSENLLVTLPERFWGILFASGLCQTFYMIGLARAYRTGNLSLVYPLARALPVFLVPILVFFIYKESQLEIDDLVGMVLIVLGAVLVPLQHWRSIKIHDYFNVSMGWVLVAALSTAGYSILDSMAINLMLDSGFSPIQAGSSFVVLQSAVSLCWMLFFILFVLREPLLGLPDKRWALLAGIFVITTYMLVLVSMSLVAEVSYVVALRQVSIPLGVIIGMLWLKEPFSLPRIQGVVVMLVGLMLVAL
ncbi:DMT family transporter [Neptunomonas japonica]|uniref:DMT family transporter n=1 Tax=Neptunomonas japonica TaxID=417574 RepID=UPI001FE072C4|nr:DMT family transporter [Neptunomonas japonica]